MKNGEGGLVLYSKDNKLFLLTLDNINYSTLMAYFKSAPIYSIKFDPNNLFKPFSTIQTSITNLSSGKPIRQLPGGQVYFEYTRKFISPIKLFNDERFLGWLTSNYNKYVDVNKKQIIREKIRKEIKKVLNDEYFPPSEPDGSYGENISTRKFWFPKGNDFDEFGNLIEK